MRSAHDQDFGLKTTVKVCTACTVVSLSTTGLNFIKKNFFKKNKTKMTRDSIEGHAWPKTQELVYSPHSALSPVSWQESSEDLFAARFHARTGPKSQE